MADRSSSPGRSLKTAIARWRNASSAGARQTCRSITPTSTPPAAISWQKLGRDGWLAHTAPDPDAPSPLDVRTLCLMRETLARHDGLADFAFAMQGLGAGPISLFGNAKQRDWLKRTRSGQAIAAFALTEPQSGSDVANIALTARQFGDGYILDGEKTWISNGGIADLYVVFARTGEGPGAKGLSAFLVPGGLAGIFDRRADRCDRAASAGAAEIRARRVPAYAMIGAPGDGFKIAMATLDIFRATVGAAALGFARRALDEAACARQKPRTVRRAARRAADGAGKNRRDGGRRRCRGAAGLSRRLGQGQRRGPRHARGCDGETLRHRPRAVGDRQSGAASRRRRRAPRPHRRTALPGNPRAPHLRGRLRSAESHHRTASSCASWGAKS